MEGSERAARLFVVSVSFRGGNDIDLDNEGEEDDDDDDDDDVVVVLVVIGAPQ